MIWSKKKKLIKALWDERLNLDIHCDVYKYHTNHDAYELPSYTVVLNKEPIWDFPGKFISYTKNRIERLPAIQYWMDKDCFAGFVLDAYIDQPKDKLFEPLPSDSWELGDILRAADRRLGKKRLLEWGETLHEENPARKVLVERFS